MVRMPPTARREATKTYEEILPSLSRSCSPPQITEAMVTATATKNAVITAIAITVRI
jgi:hypothetical protein